MKEGKTIVQLDSDKLALDAKKVRSRFLEEELSPEFTHLPDFQDRVCDLISFTRNMTIASSKIEFIQTMENLADLLFKKGAFCWNDWIFFHFWASWIMSKESAVLAEKNKYLECFPLLNDLKDIQKYKKIRSIIMNIEQMTKENFIYPSFSITNGIVKKSVLLDLFLENIYPLIVTPTPKCVHSVLHEPLDFFYHDFIHLNLYVAAMRSERPSPLQGLIPKLKRIRNSVNFSELDKNGLFFILHEIPLPISKKKNSVDYYSKARDYVEDSLNEAYKIDIKKSSYRFLRNWLFGEVLGTLKVSAEAFIDFHSDSKLWLRKEIERQGKYSIDQKLFLKIIKTYQTKNKTPTVNFSELANKFELKTINFEKMEVTFALGALGLKEEVLVKLDSDKIDDFSIYFKDQKIWQHCSLYTNYGHHVFQDWGIMLSSLKRLPKKPVENGVFSMIEIRDALILFLKDFFIKNKLLSKK